MSTNKAVGIVVIGRNEGDRLVRCLRSAVGGALVYVDSGSTDGSLLAARAAGAAVVELDQALPFTAARARNRGLEHLLEILPDAQYVQFVDGDCEICPGWLQQAVAWLKDRPAMAVVCGRVVERHPEKSIYNRLCQLEWDTGVGEVKACGGIAMMRIDAFQQVGGFNPSLIAGEEPELCVRLRAANWKIWRLNRDMCLHDAAMTRFSQWWRRAVRGGHAYAEGAWMHGRGVDRHCVKQVRSNWGWGLALPVAAVAFAWPTMGASLFLLVAAYGLLVFRIHRKRRRAGTPAKEARLYALFCAISKVPQAIGQGYFHLRRLLRRPSRLIEYKGVTT